MNNSNLPTVEIENREKQKKQYDELLKALKFITIGLPFYFLFLNFSIGSSVWSTTLIGEIIVLRGLLLLANNDKYGYWVYAAIFVNALHVASGIVAILGLSEKFNLNLQFIEAVAILFVYLKIIKIMPVFNEHSRTVVITLVLMIVASVLILTMLIATPFLAWFIVNLEKIDPFTILISIFGATLPVLFLATAGEALTFYVSLCLYKTLKRTPFEEAIPQ